MTGIFLSSETPGSIPLMKKTKLLVLVGPTASGKTGLSLTLAKQLNGEIIAADSRTVYRGMNIGTAKPEGEVASAGSAWGSGVGNIKDLFADKSFVVDGVPHWGIDLVDPDEEFTASDFKAYAEKKIEEISARGHLPMLVGGTGLYINAIVNNLSFTHVPPNPVLRERLEQMTNEALLEAIAAKDPEAAETIDAANRRRLVRALEIIETSGKTLKEMQQRGPSRYDICFLGLSVDREELSRRIDTRVDEMVAAGLVNEVRSLKERYGCEAVAMTGIGYRQICAFLLGQMKLADAIDLVKRDTKQYAKRQMTWFKRDERIQWIEDPNIARSIIQKWMG